MYKEFSKINVPEKTPHLFDYIKDLFNKTGMTREEAAELSMTEPTAWHNWLNGVSDYGVIDDNLIRISILFGVDINDLLDMRTNYAISYYYHTNKKEYDKIRPHIYQGGSRWGIPDISLMENIVKRSGVGNLLRRIISEEDIRQIDISNKTGIKQSILSHVFNDKGGLTVRSSLFFDAFFGYPLGLFHTLYERKEIASLKTLNYDMYKEIKENRDKFFAGTKIDTKPTPTVQSKVPECESKEPDSKLVDLLLKVRAINSKMGELFELVDEYNTLIEEYTKTHSEASGLLIGSDK